VDLVGAGCSGGGDLSRGRDVETRGAETARVGGHGVGFVVTVADVHHGPRSHRQWREHVVVDQVVDTSRRSRDSAAWRDRSCPGWCIRLEQPISNSAVNGTADASRCRDRTCINTDIPVHPFTNRAINSSGNSCSTVTTLVASPSPRSSPATVLFDNRLWHSTSPNYGAHARKNLYLEYSQRSLRPFDYYFQDEADYAAADPVRKQLLGYDFTDIEDGYVGYQEPHEIDTPLRG